MIKLPFQTAFYIQCTNKKDWEDLHKIMFNNGFAYLSEGIPLYSEPSTYLLVNRDPTDNIFYYNGTGDLRHIDHIGYYEFIKLQGISSDLEQALKIIYTD